MMWSSEVIFNVVLGVSHLRGSLDCVWNSERLVIEVQNNSDRLLPLTATQSCDVDSARPRVNINLVGGSNVRGSWRRIRRTGACDRNGERPSLSIPKAGVTFGTNKWSVVLRLLDWIKL